MKLTKYLKGFCVGLATVGMLLPNVATANQTVAAQSATKVLDVSLTQGGVLKGQVLNQKGQPIAHTSVTLQQGNKDVAKATTDAQGQFAVQGLKGGVYAISTEGTTGVLRAWSDQTAPPSSVASVLLVPQDQTTRAQGGNGGHSVGGLLVLGFAAAVIAVAIDHNSAS